VPAAFWRDKAILTKFNNTKNGRDFMLKRTLLGAIALCAFAIPASAQNAYVVGLTGALTRHPALMRLQSMPSVFISTG